MKLPDELLEQTPAVKLMYLWLLPQGEVSYSLSELEQHLGLARKPVMNALAKLRELGFLKDLDEPEQRKKGRYKAI